MNTGNRDRGKARLIASLALAVGLLGLSGCVAYPVDGYYGNGGYYAPTGYAYAPVGGVYVGGGYGYHRGWRRHRYWR